MKKHLIIFSCLCCCVCACLGASEAPLPPAVESYFSQFATLSKEEKWSDILLQGAKALEAAKEAHQPSEEATICAQLTSTAFYLGDYPLALAYATRCHALSE